MSGQKVSKPSEVSAGVNGSQDAGEVVVRVDRVSKNGSLLLNVGPRGDGSIPEPAVEVLETVGGWIDARMARARSSSTNW